MEKNLEYYDALIQEKKRELEGYNELVSRLSKIKEQVAVLEGRIVDMINTLSYDEQT